MVSATRRIGRRGVWRRVLAVAASGLIVLGATGPAEGEPATASEDVWALVREADGDLEVVRGDDAVEAASDDLTGQTGTDVVAIEADIPVAALGTNDPLRPQQWPLDATSFESTWITTRGGGVVVAVVDSGVRGDHEDLAGALLPGIDYVNGTDGRVDPNGHGTHIAGVIAAHTSNGRGIAGAAPDVKILPVRVLDENGAGSSSDVTAGIVWAVDHGARIVNLSLGGTVASQGMAEAIDYATERGVIVVAAAGNGGAQGNAPVYPAAFSSPIAVSALDTNRSRASFSNWGNYVDLAAPGVGIVSTYSSSQASYASSNGTSMATPFISSAAALVLAANPSLTPDRVRDALEGAARDLGAPGWDAEFGHGLVDPRAAVNRGLPPLGGHEGRGYWVVGADGRVQAFGGAPFLGDLGGRALSAPIVAGTPTPGGNGYWLAGADGAVYAFGDAGYHGSMSGRSLNGRVVGLAATPSGNGYVLLGNDGGIFSFGDAAFYGSTGGMRLNAPILDLTMSPTGRGYWFVGADGGVFSFGDAAFHGSTGGIPLAAPVMSMTASSDGRGYWTIASDGGVFAFDVPFHGSLPQLRVMYGLANVAPALRLRALPGGAGYYILGADGGVFALGSARYHGSGPTFAVDLMLLP